MISAVGLSKTFPGAGGPVEAVRGLTFEIGAGEVVGLLGPNGAGKTTTMRMLCTLERPTSGRACIAGHDVDREAAAVRKAIGLVSQGGGTRRIATARDELTFQADLHRLPRAGARVEEMLELFGLREVADRPTAGLSGGQRRRLDLAAGLIHAPAVVFLDEPTAALDPAGRSDLWTHIRGLRDRTGATVVLSTHHLEEADALCDRLLVVDHGRLVADDTPTRLKAKTGDDVITVDLGADLGGERAGDLAGEGGDDLAGDLGGEHGADRLPAPVHALIEDIPHVHTVNSHGGQLRIGTRQAESVLARVVASLHDQGIPVRGVHVAHPTLDDVFLALTGRTTQEA